MNRERYAQFAAFLLTPVALLSLYVWSRFTVDDAFITWRYGRNLIDIGIWGYNPTDFDLTQAYTNPLMALLSIVPAYSGMDVVLFFKILSIISVIIPFIWLLKIVKQKCLMSAYYLAFLAVPATVVHAFSGLETFIFVALMSLLFISLVRKSFWFATISAAILLFIRPEAWLLICLLPAYYFFSALQACHYDIKKLAEVKKLSPALTSFACLGLCFALYAVFHYHHFGYVFPNTFYVKHGATFDWQIALRYLIYLMPMIALWLKGYRLLSLFISLFFLPVIYNYATSYMYMNYAERFGYHIFGPIYLLFVYLLTFDAQDLTEENEKPVIARIVMSSAGFFLLFVFVIQSTSAISLVTLSNFYPRHLNAHAALGKLIGEISKKYEIRTMAIGDAGMAPYHARITNLDNYGLGSALVAHEGATAKTYEQYNPQLVMLFATGEDIPLNMQSKKTLLQWTLAKGYHALCDVYERPEYRVRIFAAKNIPELMLLCDQSKATNGSYEKDFFLKNVLTPPWHYWHE